MKRSPLIARTSIAAAGALLLACFTGCDQQSGQLTGLTESFQSKIAEKDKLLTEARNAEKVAVAQKAELEGKLSALQAELDKAHASGGSTTGGAPAISAKDVSVQVAAALDPLIRKALKDAIASMPTPMSSPNPRSVAREDDTPPFTSAKPPKTTNDPGAFNLGDPRQNPNRRPPPVTPELKEKPAANNGAKPNRDDGPIDITPPRGANRDDKEDKPRPTGGTKEKSSFDLPPLPPGR